MKKTIKIGIFIISAVLLLCITIILICNLLVVNNAKGKTFSEIDSIRPTEVGLLLGKTPHTHTGNFTNYFFVYRIDAAEQLCKDILGYHYILGAIKYYCLSQKWM